MTDNAQDLARRAVACPGWRWMPGMRLENRDRLTWLDDWWHASAATGTWVRHRPERLGDESRGTLPDLTDPATLGCLLALVREAWGDAGMHARPAIAGQGWVVVHPSLAARRAPTEAAALVAALEAAPANTTR